jgi:hypothetical protein
MSGRSLFVGALVLNVTDPTAAAKYALEVSNKNSIKRKSNFMKLLSNNRSRRLAGIGLSLLLFAGTAFAQAVERAAFGPNPAAIQPTVDLFRADLGALNPNTGQSFAGGRREINWDDVPDPVLSELGFMPPNYYNTNIPAGIVLDSTAGPVFGLQIQPMRLSYRAETGVRVRFGNINPSYTNEFQTFSAQRLFTTTPESNILEVSFFIPGTNTRATVNGFGAVFTDVDTQVSRMQFYDDKGNILLVPNGGLVGQDKGLTFQGVSYNDGTRISKVRIFLGNAPLSAANTDGVNGIDVVALDDIIYGEPRAADYHEGDFDGDGAADLAVFRPETGQWFVLDSGSNSFEVVNWGSAGDRPVVGDFDGDRRSDFVVFRPSTGTWWRLNSSDNQVVAINWGQAGDVPEAGDFDNDGKSDIAVFRPTDGSHWIVHSRDNSTVAQHWGTNGDIPVTSIP